MTTRNEVLKAAEDGRFVELLELVRTQPGLIDVASQQGWTPLCHAAHRGDLATVRALIGLGADLRRGDPMKIASDHNHVRVVIELAEAGVDVGFSEACKAGLIDAVRALLRSDPEYVHAMDRGHPVIDWTCEAGQVEVGRALVAAGAPADVFTCASLGLVDLIVQRLDEDAHALEGKRPLYAHRPLHCAAECGQPEIVDLLLRRGADANAGNEWGATPVFFSVIAARHHPATEKHLECCRLLMDRGARAVANVGPEDALSTFAENAIGYAPDEEHRRVAERILALVRDRE